MRAECGLADRLAYEAPDRRSGFIPKQGVDSDRYAAGYVISLAGDVPSTEGVVEHACIVKREADRRRLALVPAGEYAGD